MELTELYLALKTVLETPDRIEENLSNDILPNIIVLYNQQYITSVDILNSN